MPNLVDATVVEVKSQPYNPYDEDVAFVINGNEYYCIAVDIVENCYGRVEEKTKTFCSTDLDVAYEKASKIEKGYTYKT